MEKLSGNSARNRKNKAAILHEKVGKSEERVILEKKLKKRLLILMSAMVFVGVSATDIYIPSLPEMVIYFHAMPGTVNLTLAAFNIGIAVMGLVVGELSDRYGRRRVLIAGLFIFAMTAFLMAIVNNLLLIIFLRVIQALGGAAILMIPRLILKDSMGEQEQIRANGMLLISLIISPAISPVIGAHLATWFGWQSCFWFSAIASSLLTYLAYRILPETNLAPIHRFRRCGYYVRSYGRLLSNRVFLTLALIYACGNGAYFTFIGVSSYLYINSWHISPIKYSLIFFCLSCAYLTGNFIMQKLNTRNIRPINIIASGVYSTLIGNIIILLAALLLNEDFTLTVILVSIAVFFMRAANALINPPTQIKIMSHFRQESAHALGLNMFFSFSFSSIATYGVTIVPTHPFASLVVFTTTFISICVGVFWRNRQLID